MKWVEKYRSKIIRFTFGDVNIDNLHYPIRFGDRRELNVHIHFNMREKLNWISAKNFSFHFVCGAFVLCQIWFKIVFVPFIIATAADAPWRVAANAAYAAFCKQIRKPTKNLLFFFFFSFIFIRHESGARWTMWRWGNQKINQQNAHLSWSALRTYRIDLHLLVVQIFEGNDWMWRKSED